VLDAGNPGETGFYNYDIQFAGTAGASYRNDADITIINHAGQVGDPFGPQACTDFSIPSTPTVTYEDATATLSDTFNCPTGFTCNPVTDNGPWDLTDSATKTVTVDVTNSNICNVQNIQLINTAKVVEGTTKRESVSDANVAINTAPCKPVITGCTSTQGYWKTHPNWPVPSLTMGGNSYTKTELLSILNTPVKGNGLIALAYQQIAALLNIAGGASAPSQIGVAISSANALMATANGKVPPSGLGYLTTSQTSYLTGVLDSYNQGLATDGPLHCQ
jgi:hypothetical protein